MFAQATTTTGAVLTSVPSSYHLRGTDRLPTVLVLQRSDTAHASLPVSGDVGTWTDSIAAAGEEPVAGDASFQHLWSLVELLVGGLRGAPVVVVVLLAPSVAVGYAFISMVPLTVLLEEKRALPTGRSILPQ